MQVSSLLGHVQELLGNIRRSTYPAKNTAGRPADSLIDSFFRSHKYLGSHDRRFIAETTYGTLRHLRRCEFILQHALGREAQDIPNEDGLLLLATTYLLSIDQKTVLKRDDIVGKLKSKALKERISDILRELPVERLLPTGDEIERLAIEYSYPDWIVKRLFAEMGGEETRRILQSLNEPAPLTLRVNTLKATVEQCQDELNKQNVPTTRTTISPVGLQVTKRLNIFSLKAFQDGMFEVQDEGSQLLPLLIDPKPTAKLLDACAGAGGKSLGFAALMKNRGEIFATDTNGYRLRELKKRSRRAGAFNIRPLEVHALEDLSNKHCGYFDVVFVDAPCSGLGTIRRNPGLKWAVTEETVSELSQKQASILQQCASLVKSGGRLIYATCTLIKQENENVVIQFVQKNPEFRVTNPDKALAKIGIEKGASGEVVKLLPHIHRTDGFFCAIMEKAV
jgi:16S rRNA (cytosine967-C5)-methyltransferase